MALEDTFSALKAAGRALQKSLTDARWAVTEAKPAGEDVHLVEQLADLLLDLQDLAKAAAAAAGRAHRAAGYPTDLERARRALRLCQSKTDEAAARFAGELVNYERVRDVVRLGRRNPAWRDWSRGVRQAVDRCRKPFADLSAALVAAWVDVAERCGPASVSVRSTSVGQITIPEPAAAQGFG